MQKPLILVSSRIDAKGTYESRQSNGLVPRQDYVEIAQRLGAKLVGYDLFDAVWYRWVRRLEKQLKLDLVEALFAAIQSSKHNAILSTSEKLAIPLAALLSVVKPKIPHIVIAHKLSSGLKTHLFRTLHLHKIFSHVICVCRTQADYAVSELGMPESRVDFVYDKVDHRFFYPLKGDTDDYVLAVGQEQRDYQTLLRAMSGIGIRLVVVASSPWSTSQVTVDKLEDVIVLSHIPYQELKALYARARLIVVPLFDVDYAAGVNTVLEAMAMAKPVIVSHTRGIMDYIVHNETGIYVSPKDSKELRDTILRLWGKTGKLDRLGTNARQAVETRMNLDIYTDNIVQIVHRAMGQ